MITFIIITTLSYLAMIILLWKKPKLQSLEKNIFNLTLLFILLSILVLYLLTKDFRFYGVYTNSIIGQATLSLTILLFGLAKTRWVKISSGIASLSFLVLSLTGLVFKNALILIPLILFLIFCPAIETVKIDDNYNVERHQGGVLGACPNSIYLVENNFPFQKLIYQQVECTAHLDSIRLKQYQPNKTIIYNSFGTEFNDSIVTKVDTIDLSNR